MSWKKSRLVKNAYGAFGLQALAFSLTPEMMAAAVDILDAMMANWQTEFGIRIGYNNGGDAEPNPEQESGLPDHTCEAVYLGLAERLADTIGKALSPKMAARCQLTFDQLASYAASHNIPDMQLRRNTPSGSGNKPWQTDGATFIQSPATRLDTGAGDDFIDGNNGTAFVVDGSGDDA